MIKNEPIQVQNTSFYIYYSILRMVRICTYANIVEKNMTELMEVVDSVVRHVQENTLTPLLTMMLVKDKSKH